MTIENGLAAADTILVYRLGSIGDFVVALPCLHLLRRRFPQARIGLLTNRPAETLAAPAESVVGGIGLIDWFLKYPLATRSLRELSELRAAIRARKPQLLVYLAAPRGTSRLYRDYAFFKWCGIPRIAGLPLARDLRDCRPAAAADGTVEREAARLGRCIAEFGSIAIDDYRSWDLRLTAEEIAAADRAIADANVPAGNAPFLALCVGTKQPLKDWGDDNWRIVLRALGDAGTVLALIGAAEERERSAMLASLWPGPVVNLCGRLSPRASAAALMRASLLICTDSGPMHLAAAVGTRCVAVFSGKDSPGRWFPCGEGHALLYPRSANPTIADIEPQAVVTAARRLLSRDAAAAIG